MFDLKELKLNNNEDYDTDFVLSKSNIDKSYDLNHIESKKIEQREMIDLTEKNSYLFKSWNSNNSPMLPMIQIEQGKNNSTKLWIHTNNIAERVDLNSKKSLEILL